MIDQNYIDNSTAQMRKGTLEFCVLLTISNSERYASDILNNLKEHNLIVVEGTLYPILSRLKESELKSCVEGNTILFSKDSIEWVTEGDESERMFKFDVNTGKQLIIYGGDKTGFKDIIIKFALYIPNP